MNVRKRILSVIAAAVLSAAGAVAPEAGASVLPHPVNKVAVIAMTAANAVHFLRFFITFSSFNSLYLYI